MAGIPRDLRERERDLKMVFETLFFPPSPSPISKFGDWGKLEGYIGTYTLCI